MRPLVPIALLLLLVSSFASAKTYSAKVTSVTVGDHQALIEGTTDAPPGTPLALVVPDGARGNSAWRGLRVDGAGRFQVQLARNALLTGYSVLIADSPTEFNPPPKSHYVFIDGTFFLSGLGGEGKINLPLILLAYLATGLYLMLRANRLGIQHGRLWLLLPLASVPFLLQGRPRVAWLAQALQWFLLGHSLVSQLAAPEFYNPRVQVMRFLFDAVVWWMGWALAIYWASAHASAAPEASAPDPKWAWACLIPQALVGSVPGLAQLLQGRAGRGLTFLYAGLALRAVSLARPWWALLTAPAVLPGNKFEAMTHYAGLLPVTLASQGLLVLCLAEAFWFAWRATKDSKPSLAEEEAKAG